MEEHAANDWIRGFHQGKEQSFRMAASWLAEDLGIACDVLTHRMRHAEKEAA